MPLPYDPKDPILMGPDEAEAVYGIPRVTYVITSQRSHVLKGSPSEPKPEAPMSEEEEGQAELKTWRKHREAQRRPRPATPR